MSDNQFPQMLYKAGGPEQLHGGQFTTLIAEDFDQLEQALDAGWAERTDTAVEMRAAAVKAAEPPAALAPADTQAGPTRAELEQKATELGIEYSRLIGDAKLAERIAAKLAE